MQKLPTIRPIDLVDFTQTDSRFRQIAGSDKIYLSEGEEQQRDEEGSAQRRSGRYLVKMANGMRCPGFCAVKRGSFTGNSERCGKYRERRRLKMLSTYKEKILQDLDRVPEDKMPVLYQLIHLLTTEFSLEKKTGQRGSLRGIWQGSQVDASLFMEARRSLFPYEQHEKSK
jgi:hypothetical protein